MLVASGCSGSNNDTLPECTEGVCPCNEGGLRAAIAEGRGPYTFDCSESTRIRINRELIIESDVTLDGGGIIALDADGRRRVLSVLEGATVELIGFTVINGGVVEGNGGAIHNEGELTLTGCAVADSSAGRESGCRTDDFQLVCAEGGGIWNDGTLTLNASSVIGSSAPFGGGIANRGGVLTLIDSRVEGSSASGCRNPGGLVCSGGGAIWNSGALTMLNSVVSDCTADWGGGIYNRGFAELTDSTVSDSSSDFDGGGLLNFETLALIDTTVAGSVAGQSGGAVANQGGVLEVARSTLSGNSAAAAGGAVINQSGADVVLLNSTVSGNTAERGGAIYSGGSLSVTSSTIAANEAPDGSAIFDPGNVGQGPGTLRSTLVEGSCSGSELGSEGYNVEGPGSTCGLDQETDRSAEADLGLGPLDDNGGPTRTHALSPISVAVDRIPEVDCLDASGESLTADQRGTTRPSGGTSACDVGSFEVQQ